MPQVFTSSADIGGANRTRANLSAGPFVSGYRPDSTGVNTGSTGAWPLASAGGFIPVQPLLASFAVTTSAADQASYTYIATVGASLSSGPKPTLTGAGGNMYTTGYLVAPLCFDTATNKLWIFNPVSSVWVASTLNFTSTST